MLTPQEILAAQAEIIAAYQSHERSRQGRRGQDRDLIQPCKVEYRALQCGLCYHIFEWLGTRMPNHCPECGKLIFNSHTITHWFDSSAQLSIRRN